MSGPLRVVFLGSDGIALPLLTWLKSNPTKAELVAVFTQPDRPVGRGQKVQANAIKLWAIENGIPVHQPEKLTTDVNGIYAAMRPDLALVMAYGHILKDAFIAIPRLGTVNFHASLLPKYRGASPIQTAVAMGERETGVSLMQIVRKLDAGPVADQERVSIHSTDTALDIEAKLSTGCVPLLERNWAALASGALAFAEQRHEEATYCRKLAKEDALIDWSQPARLITSRINGLNPWPGANFVLGDDVIKVGRAALGKPTVGNPGKVVGVEGDALVVLGSDGEVRLLELQRAGGRMIPAADYLRGNPIALGRTLGGGFATKLVQPEPFRSA